MGKSTSYGAKGFYTIGEFREFTKNLPDHFTIFADINSDYFNAEHVVTYITREGGSSCINLKLEQTYIGKDPDMMINDLEDKVENLEDQILQINKILVRNLEENFSPKLLFDMIEPYL